MPTLHALLTAVNHYHPHPTLQPPALQGCQNDLLRWQVFLEDRFPKERRQLVALVDEAATYQNVVHHFGEAFLLKAKTGDTVLFTYSGHGSREEAAPEFLPYYPEGKNETLVLYDSRVPGGLDLADKELAVLLERIALKGVQVIVVLDCCHSGSGTRAIGDVALGAIRHASSRQGPRALGTYLDGEYVRRGQNLYTPNSRHLLMAACDRRESAWETRGRQGLFSSVLLSVLESTGGRLSYADLYTRCRIAMAQVTDQQRPQFETNGFFNGYDGFLGLSEASQGAPLRIFFDKNNWQASMGALHGLPVGSGNPAQFGVWKEGAVLGFVSSRMVGAEASSLVPPAFALSPGETYEARLCSLPVPKAVYGLQGATPGQMAAAKQALAVFKPVYFDLLENVAQAEYRMAVDERAIRLIRKSDGLCLLAIEGDHWDKMFQHAFETLERVSHWERTLALDNKDTRIRRDEVALVLTELDTRGAALRSTVEATMAIEVLRVNGQEQRVPFRLQVRNDHPDKTRHCAMFYASDNYGFSPVGFNEPVPPQSTAIAMERNAKGIPYAFELNGKNEATDIFKLFVSNIPINGTNLAQKGFKVGDTVGFWRTRAGESDGLQPSKPRGIFALEEMDGEADVLEWYTISIKVVSRVKNG